jgi:hypothetical protein
VIKLFSTLLYVENLRLPIAKRRPEKRVPAELYAQQAANRREAEGPGSHLPLEERGSKTIQNHQDLERPEEATHEF